MYKGQANYFQNPWTNSQQYLHLKPFHLPSRLINWTWLRLHYSFWGKRGTVWHSLFHIISSDIETSENHVSNSLLAYFYCAYCHNSLYTRSFVFYSLQQAVNINYDSELDIIFHFSHIVCGHCNCGAAHLNSDSGAVQL